MQKKNNQVTNFRLSIEGGWGVIGGEVGYPTKLNHSVL